MVVKSQIKFIKSLQQKKSRIENGLFVVEGRKMVFELLNSVLVPQAIYCTNPALVLDKDLPVFNVNSREIGMMSSLKTPSEILAVFEIPKPQAVDFSDWVVVLDKLQDPGNLGTIIRLCDWFNIPSIVCSNDTVDCFNPKVLQATMGSIARVNISYRNLPGIGSNGNSEVFGTFTDGKSVYDTSLPKKGILILGNEGHGISQELRSEIDHEISIPQFGNATAESLNVASATAIFLNEIRRQPKS
ncbi:TrmH family RNA methyltransferase [Eudoraea chungangensis]|uniref:TrmH family RNA methyltransferase n=1 Tax=Eudoraea chungangensis TaxID=1481905 RepID=UPI0023ED32A3|nr:RNA methyltransferase [Eudoraea chungangensis]